MSNPFASWTPAMIEAHNARVGQKKKEVIQTEKPTNLGTQQALSVRSMHSVPGAGAVTTGERASAPNTRQMSTPVAKHPFTNLVVQQSTDEQELNKLERDWLRHLRLTHPADHIGVQSITLKLGNDCRYTPDFWTIDANGQLIFWETKGFMRGDADVKLRVAARQFRHFRFILVERKKGQWIETPIAP